MDWIYDLLDKISTYIGENLWVAPLFSVFLPFIEAIIPSLPLTAIIAINISAMSAAFGAVTGTIFAIVFSALGSFLGMLFIFVIIRKTLSQKFVDRVNQNQYGRWFTNIVEKGNTGLMLTILSNPLLPSSILNYAMSLTRIETKKYIFLTLTSRVIIILFLTTLGTVFDIQNNPLNILWVMLVYSGIIAIYGLIVRYRNNKKKQISEDSIE